MKAKHLLLAASLILITSTLAVATEIPTGPVTGHWYASGNPYNINGEINVPANGSLYIHEGVQVIFQGHYKFIVNSGATLHAVGTEEDSIRFTAANTSVGWYKLRITNSTSSASIAYCVFEYSKSNGTTDIDRRGGALYVKYDSVCVSHSRFSHNYASDYGGGAFFAYSTSTISKCIFSCNNVNAGGAGIYFDYQPSPTMTDCVIDSNIANIYGGGMVCFQSKPIITNCLFANNDASSYGAFTLDTAPISFKNLTVVNNTADSLGAIRINLQTSPPCSLTNVIIWGNTGGTSPIVLQSASVVVQYSDVQGSSVYPGAGNILSDPQFIQGFYLKQNPPQTSPPYSLCKDAGYGSMITGTTRTDGVQDQLPVDMGYHDTITTPSQVLVLTDYSLTPTHPTIYPGGSFTARYQIQNNTGTNQPAQLDLRYRAPNTSYGEFTPYVFQVTITPGTNWYERPATMPTNAQQGNYCVAWYLLNQSGSYITSTPYLDNQVTVLLPVQEPNITVSPSSWNFLSLMIFQGLTREKDFVIANTGTQALTVSSITLSLPTDYSLINPPSFPLVLAGNSSEVITVSFHPTNYGFRSCNMVVASNDPQTPTLSVALQGTGTPPGPPVLQITDIRAYSGSGITPPRSAEDATIEVDITNEGESPFNGDLKALVAIADFPNMGETDGFWVSSSGEAQMRDATWFYSGTATNWDNPSLCIQNLGYHQTHTITLRYPAHPTFTPVAQFNYKFTDPNFSDQLEVELWQGEQNLVTRSEFFSVELNTMAAWKNCVGELCSAFGPYLSGIAEAALWATEKLSNIPSIISLWSNLNESDIPGALADLEEMILEAIEDLGGNFVGFVMNIIEGAFSEFNNNGCFAASVGLVDYIGDWLADLFSQIWDLFGSFFGFIIGCPVDVQVLDASGRIVARVTNDGICEIDDDSTWAFMAGEYKVIIVPANQQYTLQVAGTDTGDFDLTVFQSRTNGSFARVSFDSVLTGPNSMASMVITQQTTNFVLDIDLDGNGTIDTIHAADTVGIFDATPPDSFVLLSPTNGATLTSFASVAFDWQDTEDPISPTDTIRYRFMLDDNEYFQTPIVMDSLLSSQYILNDSLVDNTIYWWKVIAFDEDGLPRVCTGGYRTFTTNAYNNPPSITLLTPPAAGATADTVYLIQWTDDDPDDNALIRLFYDTDSIGHDGFLISPDTIWEDDETDYYIWQIYGVQPGNYYHYASISDGDTVVYDYSPGRLTITATGVRNQPQPLPSRFEFTGITPNPFNLSASINYTLPHPAQVKVEIFNLRGQLIATLMDGRQDAGYHRVIWQAQNQQGQSITSGIYLCRLQAEEFTVVKKMVLLK